MSCRSTKTKSEPDSGLTRGEAGLLRTAEVQPGSSQGNHIWLQGLVFNRGLGGLIENASHMTVALGGPMAAAYSRTLVVTGVSAHPGQAPTQAAAYSRAIPDPALLL